MDLRPIDRVNPHPEALTAVRDQAPRARALRLAAFCIAAFECSQLVFHSPTCPYWADERAQVAAAGGPPAAVEGRV